MHATTFLPVLRTTYFLNVHLRSPSGKYTPDGPKPSGPRGNIYAKKIREIQPLIEVLRAVGQGRGKTPAQVRAAAAI